MQDEIENLDDFTELEDTSVFKLEMANPKPYEKDYNAQMDITIEMNLDQEVIARTGYTFLDYLSDIGGIMGILFSGVAYLMGAWNFNNFDNYMVTRLYKLEKKDEDKQDFKSFWHSSSFVSPRMLSNLKDYFQSFIPRFLRCCRCCQPDRQERYFELAREHLQKEINIVNIIKSHRIFAQSLKVLMTKG